jgi:hypothetical protein
MNADEKDLLHRHLNGDLDAAEQAAFFARLEASPELRRELASLALDEALISELVLEKRTVAHPKRRAWIPAAAVAAVMLIALTLVLTVGRGTTSGFRVASVEGEARVMLQGDSPKDIGPGFEPREGDILQTFEGKAVLEHGGTRLELEKQSTLIFAKPGIRLVDGCVLARADTRSPLWLNTPKGAASLESAIARFDARRNRLRVDVEYGSVVLFRDKEVRVDAGQYAILDAGIERGQLVPRAKLDDAVGRACAFLESRRADLVLPIVSEKRNAPPPRRTYAELALLALHRAGYPDSHPLKGELLGQVRGRPVESTYIAALQAMALAEIDPAAHQDRIRLCAQALCDSQCANGQWDYAVKPALPDVSMTGRIRRRAEGPKSGDNSVTAYAVLGLHAAARSGVDLDPVVIARARAWWLSCQNADGGWGYNEAGNLLANDADKTVYTTNASYGSATAAAVAALVALRELRNDEARSDAAILNGVTWLGANFAADHTPRKAPGFLPLHWLSMAGRAGQLLATEHFGTHDWYAEGADFLLRTQHPSGEWTAEQGEFMRAEKMDVLDTCLAILFLKRDSR